MRWKRECKDVKQTISIVAERRHGIARGANPWSLPPTYYIANGGAVALPCWLVSVMRRRKRTNPMPSLRDCGRGVSNVNWIGMWLMFIGLGCRLSWGFARRLASPQAIECRRSATFDSSKHPAAHSAHSSTACAGTLQHVALLIHRLAVAGADPSITNSKLLLLNGRFDFKVGAKPG